MKIKNLNFKAITLAGAIALSGCSIVHNEKHANSADHYMVVYMDGEPYLCEFSTLDYFRAQFGKMDFTDVSTEEVIAQFSTSYDTKQEVEYSNEKGSQVSRWATIPFTDISSSNKISSVTIDFFRDYKEEAKEWLDCTVEYPVEKRFIYKDETYDTTLNLYTFYDEIEDKTTYHIGYKAAAISDCNTIYDITHHRVYSVPEVGEVSYQHINEYYDGDSITSEQASKILEEYVTEVNFSKEKTNVKFR